MRFTESAELSSSAMFTIPFKDINFFQEDNVSAFAQVIIIASVFVLFF